MRISEHVFEGEEVVLDFHNFDHCTFKRCRLVVHGVGGFDFLNCEVVSCQWHFGGPAAVTMNVLEQLYRGGFAPIVEQTFKQIMHKSKRS
jgi:hypothetical protein